MSDILDRILQSSLFVVVALIIVMSCLLALWLSHQEYRNDVAACLADGNKEYVCHAMLKGSVRYAR